MCKQDRCHWSSFWYENVSYLYRITVGNSASLANLKLFPWSVGKHECCFAKIAYEVNVCLMWNCNESSQSLCTNGISMYNNRKWGNPTSTALQSLLPYLIFNKLGKYHYSYSSKSHIDPRVVPRETQGLWLVSKCQQCNMWVDAGYSVS